MQIGFAGCHTEPRGAFKEIDHLLGVKDWAQTKWPKIANFIAMGDLNMDCSYVSNTKEETLKAKIAAMQGTLWVPDEADTTVAKSSCAYDRLISFGPVSDKVQRDSVAIIRYDQDPSGSAIMPYKDAKRVSDHYPLVFKIRA